MLLSILIPDDEIEYDVILHSEDIPVRGNATVSGDDEFDRKVEDSIIRDLDDGNPWAWCTIEIRARFGKWSGRDTLGCCSYKSQAEFENDVYFSDMKRQAKLALFREIASLD